MKSWKRFQKNVKMNTIIASHMNPAPPLMTTYNLGLLQCSSSI